MGGIKVQMKKWGKILEKVIIGLVFLYVGYNLITGQMELTVEGYLVLLVLVPAALLVGFFDMWKNKKHQERVQDASGNLSGESSGVGNTDSSHTFYSGVYAGCRK